MLKIDDQRVWVRSSEIAEDLSYKQSSSRPKYQLLWEEDHLQFVRKSESVRNPIEFDLRYIIL